MPKSKDLCFLLVSGLFGNMEGRLFQGAGVGTLLSGPKEIDLFLDWF